MKKNQEIEVKAKPGALTDWEAEIAAEAKDVKAQFSTSTQRLSFRGGKITVGGQVLENPLPVLVAGYTYENALYEGAFDPDVAAAPVCFAFGDVVSEMKPHPVSTKPQHSDCKSCPHNQFGSSGKGKLCKNQVKVMVIHGDVGPEALATSQMLPASIPPTSLQEFQNYVLGLRDGGLVPTAVFTEIQVVPFKTWFKVTFKPIRKVTKEIWLALKTRSTSVREELMRPYEQREPSESPAPKKKRKF